MHMVWVDPLLRQNAFPHVGQTLEVTDIHSKLLLLKRNKKERKLFLSYPKERVDADIAVL